MKTFRHWSQIGLATIATVGLLAGCSGGNGGGGDSAPQKLSPDMTETITIWHYSEDAALADLEPQQKQFAEKYPNVKFEIEFIPEEQFPNRIIGSASTKQGPDIIWYNPQFTTQFADAGAIADFDSEWKSFADASMFPDSVIQKSDGKPYGIQSYVNLNALWVNTSMLDSLGIAVPTNMDEIEAAMKKVKEADAGYGILMPAPPGVPGEWVSRPFFSAYGVSDYSDYGNENVKDMLTRVAGWVDKGYVDRGTVALAQTEAVNEFMKGKTAFYVGGNRQLPDLDTASFDAKVIPVPAGPLGDSSVYLGGQAEAIGAFGKNKALAWEFLSTTWLSQEHGAMRLGLGSIPIREDALTGDVDPNVQAYVDSVKNGIPLPSDTATTIEVGGVWSGVMSGQLDVKSAAEQLKMLAEKAGK